MVTNTKSTIYMIRRPLSAESKISRLVDPFLPSAFSDHAIEVDGQYYHLKKLLSKELALDTTAFNPATITGRMKVGETTLSHPERLGLALHILSQMSFGVPGPKGIPIDHDGKLVELPEVDHEFSKYYSVKIPLVFPFTGKYNLARNNCLLFAQRFVVLARFLNRHGQVSGNSSA